MNRRAPERAFEARTPEMAAEVEALTAALKGTCRMGKDLKTSAMDAFNTSARLSMTIGERRCPRGIYRFGPK